MSDTDWDEHYVPGIKAAKRCTIRRTGWMGDWFTSYSPRNSNNNAEGPWAHWMQLSLSILQHPATAEQRPDIAEAVKGLENTDYYSESPEFGDADIERLFGNEEA